MKKEKPQVQNILNIPINAVTMEQALDMIHAAVVSKTPLHVGVVNAAKVVNMRRNSSLENDVLSSDVIFADGVSVVWASRILGKPLPERVTGIDLMFGLLERGKRHGYRVYCFGATEEVNARVAEKIQNEYPGVILAGRRNGYFSDNDEEQIAKDIGASKADILFVAITSPKKENFLARWRDVMSVTVCHGVGGSFDVMAGKVHRAPESWQHLGLEWFYRFLQEPRRMWKRYLLTNILFLWMILKELISNKKHAKRDSNG